MFYELSSINNTFIPELRQHLQHVDANLLRIIVQTSADDAEAVRRQDAAMQLVDLVLLILLIFLIRYLPHGNLCTSPKRFDQFASISINADGLLFNLPRAKGFIEIKAGIGCLCIFL